MPTNTLSFLCIMCNSPISLDMLPTETSLRCPHCEHTYASDDGILVLRNTGGQDDYPDEVYALLADVESRHFWFSARNTLILSTMREVIGPLEGRSVLDIGCGTGFVLAALERAGMNGCGLDMHLAGLRYARKRTHGLLLCETTTRVPFSAQFDVVMLCDVIEHTRDDGAVLREASKALKDTGALVITVPAGPHLWTALDEVSGHKRRYTRQALVHAMQRADLSVRLVRYFGILLLPVQRLRRQLSTHRHVAASDDRLQLFRHSLRVPPGPLNTVLRLITAADIPLSRLPLPFGSSLIAVGHLAAQG